MLSSTALFGFLLLTVCQQEFQVSGFVAPPRTLDLASTTFKDDKESTKSKIYSVTEAPKTRSGMIGGDVDTRPIISKTGADIGAWAGGFTTCPEEIPPTILQCKLPDDFPIGTYYRNGHARFEADDGSPVIHPFDGDGMIVAMTFDPENKRMLFRNKFVETQGYINDKAAGKMTERGLFGTMKSGGFFENVFRTGHKHVANTNVIHAGDTLYALWEGGMPYELDPLTLKNKRGPGSAGETDLDGLLTKNFSAHLRYDPRKDVYVNFALDFNPMTGSTFSLYEVDATTFRSTKTSSKAPSFVSEGPGLVHDFVLSENYCIFNINKCDLNQNNAWKALIGKAGFASCIDADLTVEDTSIVIVPRSLLDEGDDDDSTTGIDPWSDDQNKITVVPVPNHFNFHFGNCFEDEVGNIVFDTVQTTFIDLGAMSSSNDPLWERGESVFNISSPNTLVRYTIDVKNKCLAKDAPPRTLSRGLPEFPSLPRAMSTRRHRYLYPVGSHLDEEFQPDDIRGGGPQGSIRKVDVDNPNLSEMYKFKPHEFPGEVVFVPKVGKDVTQPGQEDAGYLLSNVVNGRDKTTDFVIFDVEGSGSLEKGPILRQKLPTFLPHMLHGNFAEGVMFDFDEFSE